MKIIQIIILVGISIHTFSIPIKDMELAQFCKTYGFDLKIDIISQKIQLHNNNNTIIELFPDSGIAIFNKHHVVFLKDPIQISNTQVIIPKSIIQKIIQHNTQKHKTKVPIKHTNIKFVILDAGHGGKDPGNIHHNIKEKTITLSITKKIQALLKKRFPTLHIILTRNNDTFISLHKRSQKAIQLAQKGKRGIFVSIHANAALNKRTKGIETYFYSSTPNRDHHSRIRCIESLTKKLTKTPHVKTIINHLYNLHISKQCYALAQYIHTSFYQSIKTHTLDRGIKSHQPYFVITKNLLPSILVEVGFLSNKEESSFLKKKSTHLIIAQSITKGIYKFIQVFNQSNNFVQHQFNSHKP